MIAGLLYLAFYVAAAAPGLPLGWRLFGRKNGAGWIAGALIGYALTSLTIWAVIRTGVPSALNFAGAWLLVSGITWITTRRASPPAVDMPAWRRSDTIALSIVLLLTLAVSVPPLWNVGARDDRGNRYYRAYFTADFVWHTALTAEIGKFAMPPRNPYLANRPIHYYWTYFLVPAAISRTGPGPIADVQRCLKLNALFTGLLFISSVFVSARAAVPRAGAAGLAVALALVAASAEGTYEIVRLWSHGEPLSSLKYVNIDAIAAWPPFQFYRIDGLQRGLWYVLQHSTSGALGLIAIAAVTAAGSFTSVTAALLAGTALAGAVVMNPFVGSVFALAYGIAIAVDASRRPDAVRRILIAATAAGPVAAALFWCVANQMVEGAGGALQFGFSGPSRHSPILMLLLSLGPALIPAIAGLAARGGGARRPLVPSAALAVVSLFLLYFVRLTVDEAWVGFRAGHIILVALPALAARFFAWSLGWSRAGTAAAIAAVLIAGAPTLLVDEYNARDIHNFEEGPGFPWTIVIRPEQQRAFAWIRAHTPPGAIVQMDPTERGRATWSLIPSFAERRMAAGLPISLLNVPEYAEKSGRVRTMYATPDAAEASRIALSLRIAYVYVDELERRAYPGAAKFDASPQYFEPVFREGDVGVYRVR